MNKIANTESELKMWQHLRDHDITNNIRDAINTINFQNKRHREDTLKSILTVEDEIANSQKREQENYENCQ